MSAISELRERLNEQENRIAILEAALVKLLDKGGIQDFHSEQHPIGEMRPPIGFKPNRSVSYR